MRSFRQVLCRLGVSFNSLLRLRSSGTTIRVCFEFLVVGFFVGRVCRQYRNDWTPIGCGQLGWTQWQVVSHLRPLSFFSVPPYFGLVPIKSIISGMQLANIAFGPSTTGHTGIHARSSSLFI